MRRVTRRNGFSIMELMITSLILVILASLAVAGYRGYRDRAAMLVDETNQKVLLAAVKLFAYENNALPGSLSQLELRHMERAYAIVTEGKERFTVLAYLRDIIRPSVAEAQVVLPARYYNNNPSTLLCPSDNTGAASSYEIAAAWREATLQALLAGAGDSPLIQETTARHAGGTTTVVTTVNGSHRKVKREKDDKDKDNNRDKDKDTGKGSDGIGNKLSSGG